MSTPQSSRPYARMVWTDKADALLGTDTDAAIGARLKTSEDVVRTRRHKLGIASFKAPPIKWMLEMDALLGKDTDTAIAQALDTTFDSVRTRRRRLGIAPFTPKKEPLKEVIAKLGALPRPTALPVNPLQRQFDVHLPTVRRRSDTVPTWPDTEDKE